MVALLSWRRMLILGFGLVVGLALAFGYRAMGPVRYQLRVGWPPVSFLTLPRIDLYQSMVTVDIVAKGAVLRDNKMLQRQGEYYSIKLISAPFFDWLNSQIAEETPQYVHADEDWEEMLKVKYDYKSQTPAIQLKIRSGDPDEAFYLARIVPEVFRSYLLAEERDMEQEQFQTNEREMERIRDSLASAKRDAAALKLKLDMASANINPSYIAAVARENALQRRVDELAAKLASFAAEKPKKAQMDNTASQLKRTVEALTQAKKELALLRAQIEPTTTTSGLSESEARARALESKVNELAIRLVAFVVEGQGHQTTRDVASELKRAMDALSEARKKLAAARDQTEFKVLDINMADSEARVRALEGKLNDLAMKEASILAEGTEQEPNSDTRVQMMRVVGVLTDARKDLAGLRARAEAIRLESNITDQEARVRTLESKVNELTARLIVESIDVPRKEKEKHEETLAQLKRALDALSQIRKEQASSKPPADASIPTPHIAEREANVSAMERKVSELAARMAAFMAEGPEADKYDDMLAEMNRAMAALVEVREEVIGLKAKAEASTLDISLAYSEGVDRVNALQGRFESLSKRLAAWPADDSLNSEVLSRLVLGDPTPPEPVPPEQMTGRKAVMVGAVLGLGGAWLGLNFKGVMRQFGSTLGSTHTVQKGRSEEDERA